MLKTSLEHRLFADRWFYGEPTMANLGFHTFNGGLGSSILRLYCIEPFLHSYLRLTK